MTNRTKRSQIVRTIRKLKLNKDARISLEVLLPFYLHQMLHRVIWCIQLFERVQPSWAKSLKQMLFNKAHWSVNCHFMQRQTTSYDGALCHPFIDNSSTLGLKSANRTMVFKVSRSDSRTWRLIESGAMGTKASGRNSSGSNSSTWILVNSRARTR